MRLPSCLSISKHQFQIDRPFSLCASTPQVAGSWFLISTPCPFFQRWAPFSRCRRITTLLPQEVETSLGVTGFGLLPCSSCHNEPTCASGRTLIPTFLFTELFLSPIFLTYLIFLISYHLNSSVNGEKKSFKKGQGLRTRPGRPLTLAVVGDDGVGPGALLGLDVQHPVDGLLGLRQRLLGEAGQLRGVEPAHPPAGAAAPGPRSPAPGQRRGRRPQPRPRPALGWAGLGACAPARSTSPRAQRAAAHGGRGGAACPRLRPVMADGLFPPRFPTGTDRN